MVLSAARLRLVPKVLSTAMVENDTDKNLIAR